MGAFVSSNSRAPVREAQMRTLGLGHSCGHRLPCEDESHSLGLWLFPGIVVRTCFSKPEKHCSSISEKKQKEKELNHAFLSALTPSLSKSTVGDAWAVDCRSVLFGLDVAVKCLPLNASQ